MLRQRGTACARGVQLLQLLVKVLVETGALDNGGVRLGELLAVQVDKDGLDVVDELIDPREVQQRSVDGLKRSRGVK